jgi:hypothetical protein
MTLVWLLGSDVQNVQRILKFVRDLHLPVGGEKNRLRIPFTNELIISPRRRTAPLASKVISETTVPGAVVVSASFRQRHRAGLVEVCV